MSAEIAVVELDDSEAWFVTGTTDPAKAREFVELYVRDAYRGLAAEVAEVVERLRDTEPMCRSDWWWELSDPEDPSSEALLRTLEGLTPAAAVVVHDGVFFG